MTAPEGRGDREARNLARHLNDAYPDTLALLLRALGGVAGSTAAAIDSIDESTLTVVDTGGAGSAVLTLPGDPSQPLRPRLAGLVQQARAAEPAGAPTGLERMLGGHRHDSHA